MKLKAFVLFSLFILIPLTSSALLPFVRSHYPHEVERTSSAVESWLIEKLMRGQNDIRGQKVVVVAMSDLAIYKAVQACESAMAENDQFRAGLITRESQDTSKMTFDIVLKGCRSGKVVSTIDSVMTTPELPIDTREKLQSLKNSILTSSKNELVEDATNTLITNAWKKMIETPQGSTVVAPGTEHALNSLLAMAMFRKDIKALQSAEIFRLVRITQVLNKALLNHISGAYRPNSEPTKVNKSSIILKAIQILTVDQQLSRTDSAAIDNYIAFELEK